MIRPLFQVFRQFAQPWDQPALRFDVLKTHPIHPGRAPVRPATLVSMIQYVLSIHLVELLTPETRNALMRMFEALEGEDFSSRLQRFVRFVTSDDQHDPADRKRNRAGEIVQELAKQAVKSPNILIPELPWLVRDSSSMVWAFGKWLSEAELQYQLFDDIASASRDAGEDLNPAILAGYLFAVANRDIREWEQRINELSSDRIFAGRLVEIVAGSGMSDAAAKRVFELCRTSKIDLAKLSHCCYRTSLQSLSTETFIPFVGLLIQRGSPGDWIIAFELFFGYYHDSDGKPIPDEFTFELLTGQGILGDNFARSAGYNWSGIASKYIDHYPKRSWDLFRKILKLSLKQWHLLDDLDRAPHSILTKIFKSDPKKAWQCVHNILKNEKAIDSHALQH